MTKTRTRVSTEGRPWARYLRLSRAEAAEIRGLSKAERIELTNRKLDRHLEEVTAWLDEQGLPYDDDHVFRDAGLSAWKRDVRRPGWEAMMDMARRGLLAGIGIVAIDRFTRDEVTMAGLIQLAETTDVQIGGPRAGRLDLTTYEGISRAKGAAHQAAGESLATSFRLKETLQAVTKRGKPLGAGRTFGFHTVSDKWSYEVPQVPEEVAVVREVATRFLAGENLTDLANMMNNRDFRTVRGNEWTGGKLARVLTMKRYNGLVEIHGRVVARMVGEPVLDDATFESVQALLKSRRRGRPASQQFLLTGILTCADCGITMSGGTTTRRANGNAPRVYRCAKQNGGCSRAIMAEPVERAVEAQAIKLMARESNAARLAADRAAVLEARASLQATVATIERQMVKLAEKWAEGELEDDEYDAARAALKRRLARATADLDTMPEPAPTGPLIPEDGSTEAGAARLAEASAHWQKLGPDAQRHHITEYRLRPAIRARRPDAPQGQVDLKERLVFL